MGIVQTPDKTYRYKDLHTFEDMFPSFEEWEQKLAPFTLNYDKEISFKVYAEVFSMYSTAFYRYRWRGIILDHTAIKQETAIKLETAISAYQMTLIENNYRSPDDFYAFEKKLMEARQKYHEATSNFGNLFMNLNT